MKLNRLLVASLVLVNSACLMSCNTITTKTTDPVTGAVTEVTTKTTDPALVTAGINAAVVLADRNSGK